jgi:hypothetical protein
MGLGGSGHVGFAGARVRRVRARVGSILHHKIIHHKVFDTTHTH